MVWVHFWKNMLQFTHFFVASNVARYRAFKRAVSLENMLLCLLSLRYVELRLSMALVVYITLQTAVENLKIGDMASQLSYQRFIELWYFGVHFSLTLSKASLAFYSVATLYIVFKSVAKSFLSFVQNIF